MREIKMVDLAVQYARIKTEIDTAIADVFSHTQFIKGPEVKLFEENLCSYLGVKHVISCANGTDALQISLMALNLQHGDEVITPSHTYVATVEAVGLLKLKPVFVEVNPDSFTMDIDSLKRAITPKTKVIVPVHLYGQCAEMEAIMQIAQQHNLIVIEDNAQAIGADFIFANGMKKKTGTIGNIGTTSFFPSKNLGCYGDGGAIFTNDDELAAHLRMIANHGQSKLYRHDEVGVNSRLDSIQAAVLSVKLKYLDEYCERRKMVADFYDDAFKNIEGVQTPFRAKYSTHVFHQYTLKLKNRNRDEVKNKLAAKGIPSMIYYPIPNHLQKAYSYAGYKAGDFPVTEHLCESVLSLPTHTEMDSEQLNYIAENFIKAIE